MFHVPCCHGRTFSFVSLFFSAVLLYIKSIIYARAVAIRLNFPLHKYSAKRPCSHHNASPHRNYYAKTQNFICNMKLFDCRTRYDYKCLNTRNPRRFKMHHVIMGFAALAEHNLPVGKFSVAVAQAELVRFLTICHLRSCPE